MKSILLIAATIAGILLIAPGADGFNLPVQELQDYWQLKTNKSLPPVFLSKLSTTVSIGNRPPHLNHTISYHPHPLSYNLSVGGDTNASASAEAKRAGAAPSIDLPLSYNHPHPQSYDHYVTRRSGFDSIWSGLFFRESLLKEGTTVPLLKFANIRPNRFFLPRSIASNIPFSLGAVSTIFNISSGSSMYRAVKSIIDACTTLPNIGESKRCVTSAEDMIDYTLSTLGADTDIKCWSTHNWTGFGGRRSVISKLKVVYDGKFTGKQQLSCHQVPFPYLLYNCHSVSGTVFYNMDILDAKRKEKINEAVAVCHMNTSAWDPHHVAFALMGTAPGKTEVCHWVVPWDMAFTS